MPANSISKSSGEVASGAGREFVDLGAAVRTVIRCLAFAATLSAAAAGYFVVTAGVRQAVLPRRRAWWLHRLCRVLTRVVGLRLRSHREFPASGIIVSNHLSYLDVIAFSALAPCVFVAKKEVGVWPVFGWFARRAGTIFVDRERRAAVGEASAEIEAVLRAGMPVVLFAEGTSSDGRHVLPFRSSLLEPAIRSRELLTPAAISYDLAEGSPEDEVCYWGDDTLVPHLLNLFSKRRIDARVAFGGAAVPPSGGSRKQLALDLQGVVTLLHASLLDARDGR